MHPMTISADHQRGYTLVELMMTLGVLAIVTAVAVPGFRDFVQNNRAAADANALLGALHLARNEAITRGVPVSVCASSDNATCAGATDWSTGWIVFGDTEAPLGSVEGGDTLFRVFDPVGQGSVLGADATALTYRANGFLAGAAAVEFTLTVPGCTGDNGRVITVSLQGRAGVAHAVCDEG